MSNKIDHVIKIKNRGLGTYLLLKIHTFLLLSAVVISRTSGFKFRIFHVHFEGCSQWERS